MFGSGPTGLVIVSEPTANALIPYQQRPMSTVTIHNIAVAINPLAVELFVGVMEGLFILDIGPAFPARYPGRFSGFLRHVCLHRKGSASSAVSNQSHWTP